MRIRDVILLAVGIVAAILGWMHDDGIQVHRSFFIPTHSNELQTRTPPALLVTDIDGDGKPEVLVTQRRDYLTTFDTSLLWRGYDNRFLRITPKKNLPMYGDVIGLASGYLTHPKTVLSKREKDLKGVTKGRKQHIAVVTDDYRLTLYDDSIAEVWSTVLVTTDKVPLTASHASVLVRPERIFEQDVGSVFVQIPVVNIEGNYTEGYSYLAFSGQSGELRWKHTFINYAATAASPLEADTGGQKFDRLVLSRDDLATEESNEKDWTHFREAFIAALPHHYDHAWHGEIVPHIFHHNRNKWKRQLDALGNSKNSRMAKNKDRTVLLDKDDIGELGEKLGTVPVKHNTASNKTYANVLVAHSKWGLEALHLYTGRRISKVMPLRVATLYHDVDDDHRIDAVTTVIETTQSVQQRKIDIPQQRGTPFYALRKAVDQEAICAGEVTSGAPVGQHLVYRATICDSEGIFSRLGTFIGSYIHGDDVEESSTTVDTLSLVGSQNVMHERTRAITPLVTQHLIPKGLGTHKLRRFTTFMIDTGLITTTDPTAKRVVWRTQTRSTFSDLRAAKEESVTLGLQDTASIFNRVRKYPHLAAFSFHRKKGAIRSSHKVYQGNDAYILALGEEMLTVLNSENGHIAAHIGLDAPPIAPVILDDFNGDGTNDVIVTSAEGWYGFTVRNRTSGNTIPLLLMLVFGLVGLLFLTRQVSEHEFEEAIVSTTRDDGTVHHQSKPLKVKRSTD